MKIVIIGGGASGMAAALAASENPNAEVLLLERQARLGRKLLSTGNGRCNLSNLHAAQGGYHGGQPGFVRPALDAFGPERTLEWFRGLGLFTVTEPSGRVYPYSDQANSVLDVLRFALDRPNVRVLTGTEVTALEKRDDFFLAHTPSASYSCQRLIVACGGAAGEKLGGSRSGYRLLAALGHDISPVFPSLVQLKSGWSGLGALKGVRTNCAAAILRDGKTVASGSGELQFTQYGLSGPVIFDLSRDACQGPGAWTCRLDFLPHISREALTDALTARKNTNLPCEELLTGILHNRLGRVLVKSAGLSGTAPIATLDGRALAQVVRQVKALRVDLTGKLGMDAAQVTAGGALTSEFSPETMESRRIPGLFACGEVLDVDGDCGGYNLQWAWSSGILAGTWAGRSGK